MEVVAFGFETFESIPFSTRVGSGPGYDISHHSFSANDPFENADAIIFDPGCFDQFHSRYYKGWRLKEFKEARAREIYLRLRQGATVCVLVGSLPATPSNLVEDGALQRDRPQYRLLRDIGIMVEEFEVPVTPLKVKRSEFKSFLGEYGTATRSFDKDDGTFEFEICVAERWPDVLTGFATKVEKGLLICLPCLPRERSEDYINNMLNALAPGLVTFSTKALRRPPPWLAEVHLAPEVPILEQREEASKRVLACDEQLARYEPFKRILYLSDDELARAIPPVLETIGFDQAHGFVVQDTSASEHEDVRISQTTGELLLIGDAKSATGNVRAMHMAKLDEHRKASDLSADFPALCIVNTFLGARSLRTKDVRVERRQCQIARKMKVTIMRTLDLFRLLDEMLLLDPSSRDVQGFLTLLRKGGGWLEWTKEGPKLHAT